MPPRRIARKFVLVLFSHISFPLLMLHCKSVRFRWFCDWFVTWLSFYGAELLTPRPNPMLLNHPLLALRVCFFSIFRATLRICGYAVAQLVEALRYKPEGRGFISRWGNWLNPSGHTVGLESTRPLTEISSSNICWGKGGRCVGQTPLPPSCAVVRNSGCLNPSIPKVFSKPVTGYRYLYAPNLEVILPSATWGLVVPWCKGPTYHCERDQFITVKGTQLSL
jgi:hypothetical protein